MNVTIGHGLAPEEMKVIKTSWSPFACLPLSTRLSNTAWHGRKAFTRWQCLPNLQSCKLNKFYLLSIFHTMVFYSHTKWIKSLCCFPTISKGKTMEEWGRLWAPRNGVYHLYWWESFHPEVQRQHRRESQCSWQPSISFTPAPMKEGKKGFWRTASHIHLMQCHSSRIFYLVSRK